MAEDFTFTITKKIGTLSENAKGWTTELNMVSWSGRDAKYDIRSWSPEHDKMSKGITLTKEEIIALQKAISQELEN